MVLTIAEDQGALAMPEDWVALAMPEDWVALAAASGYEAFDCRAFAIAQQLEALGRELLNTFQCQLRYVNDVTTWATPLLKIKVAIA